MAQTIAVQRGSTTVTGNGTSKVTLFTQSGGAATRVILVGASANLASSGYAHSLGLFININGSGNYLPVAFAMLNYSSSYTNVYMMPDKVNSSPLTMQTGATSYTGGTASFGAATAGGIADNLQNAVIAISGTTGYQSAFYNNPVSFVPSQFWMANGDSLVASSYNGSTSTATIIYHFVTVTES